MILVIYEISKEPKGILVHSRGLVHLQGRRKVWKFGGNQVYKGKCGTAGFASISAKIWRGAIAPLAPQSDGPELQQNHCQSREGEPKGAFSIIDVMQLCMQQSIYIC